MIAHVLAQQARRPSGLLGRLFGLGMGRVNQGVNDWVISLLDIQPESLVLEIGFGPGRAIQQIERMLGSGRVSGIDLSNAMLRQAARRNRAGVAGGKVHLRIGDAAQLPYPENTFDRIYCVNVMYFWQAPQVELTEMFRVARPGARVAVYIGDREEMAAVAMTKTGVFTLYSPEEVVEALQRVGFENCRSFQASIAQGPISRGTCAVGSKPYEL
ncbi:methyltransferase domain-containing protein [Aquabacterium sp. A7-Y]|uniref:class I SAM-dependent methyltransferase n=1 Tax=Aquabacterium sp. A7-Y TaxID=1349605 RepID=UPI00223E1664|nr:methyltransferase domain-containing protein [Aquabacterium sp. A7-Y]MCW7540987.1 methyltransferase domain-containing protein [Aquabacterium sp. A7-Y]